LKVCFVSLGLYPCLAGDYSSGQIGGAEVQQTQIATALVQQGVEVSAITEDFGQPEGAICDGITIHKSYRSGAGLPVLRFFHPKLTSIYQALIAAEADIYYVRTASFLTAVVSFYCRRNGKRWVYAGAHDTDFIPGEELVPNFRDRWLYRHGLEKADRVIVQSDKQRTLLEQYYNRDSVLIRNFINKNSLVNVVSDEPVILWVSTMRRWKRPELLLEIARSLPEIKFIMVGGPDALDNAFYQDIERQAEAVDNVEFLGFRPFDETEKLFDRAAVFINTSEHEGFPNTFLQAWRRGLPVVTYFDPDNIVSGNRLGQKINSVVEAEDVIPKMCEQDPERSQHIRNYFSENHSGKVVNKYIEVFEGLL